METASETIRSTNRKWRAVAARAAPVSPPRPILVLGAESLVGREVVAGLAAKGARVTAALAAGGVMEELRRPGVECLDLGPGNSDGLARHLVGARSVFVSTRRYFNTASLESRLIDALTRAGVSRVVFLSSFEAGAGANGIMEEGYGHFETLLLASGLSYTILRANPLMQEFTTAEPPYPVIEGRVLVPGRLRAAFVDARDVAAVAVKCLLETGHERLVYTVTGPSTLGLEEVAEYLSAHSGITYRYTEPDAFRAKMRAQGYSETAIATMFRHYAACRQGAAETVLSTVKRIVGRDAIPFARFARDYARALPSGATGRG